jgi:hypothetical protein
MFRNADLLRSRKSSSGKPASTVIPDRNPAQFTEDFLAKFKGRIAATQQVEVACRPCGAWVQT